MGRSLGRAAIPLGILLSCAIASASLPLPGGVLATGVFLVASLLWAVSRIDPALVALAGATVLVAGGAFPVAALPKLLAADILWLMAGAFVLGRAIVVSGLAGRIAARIFARARRLDHLYWLVAVIVVPLTFLVPSTSGRAAVMLPLHRGLSALVDRRAASGLALLIPAVVLTTTIAALTGAGSHLVANDLLKAMGHDPIGYSAWIIHGLPFALAAGAICVVAVLKLSLSSREGRAAIALAEPPRTAWTTDELRVAGIGVSMMSLWVATDWHGMPMGLVALLGALALVSPFGTLTPREACRAIGWDLLALMIGSLVIAGALVETGAASAIASAAVAAIGEAGAFGSIAVLAALGVFTLASHLLITSHAARAATLVPSLIVVASALGLDAAATVFIGTVGMNYCLTLPVSSKALLMYHGGEGGLTRGGLLRLGAIMAPVHLALIVLFALTWWRWTGLL